jgi:hypothetical protein
MWHMATLSFDYERLWVNRLIIIAVVVRLQDCVFCSLTYLKIRLNDIGYRSVGQVSQV